MYNEKEAYLYIIKYIIKNNSVPIQNLIKNKCNLYSAELTDIDNVIVNAFWILDIKSHEIILDNVNGNIIIKENRKSFFDNFDKIMRFFNIS